MPVSDREAAVNAVRRASSALRTLSDYLAIQEPPKPVEGEIAPLFGIDVSEHQKDIDLKQAEREGASFCFVRITGGAGPKATRGVWVDANAARNLKMLAETSMVPGVYGFPVKPGGSVPPVATQVDVFLRNAGNLDGKLIGVDYERYEPNPKITATPDVARAYTHELQRRLGNRYLEIYAGKEFWEEDIPGWPHSGQAADYGAPGTIRLWAPWWYSATPVPNWQHYYLQNKDRDDNGWFEPFGGLRPNMAQICIGIVDGRPCDINVFDGTREQLLKLTGEHKPGEEPDPDEPDEDGMPAWITKPRDYLYQCPGGPYVPWLSGRFTNRAPAWVGRRGDLLPAPENVRQQGGFCVAAHNLAQWVNGIHPGDDVDSRPAWYGGVLWLGEIYQRERHVSRRPLQDPEGYPDMAAFVKNYQCGPFDATCPLPAQGHLFVKLADGVCFNFDRQYGGNVLRDVRESMALTRGIDFWVHPNDWLRPAGAAKI